MPRRQMLAPDARHQPRMQLIDQPVRNRQVIQSPDPVFKRLHIVEHLPGVAAIPPAAARLILEQIRQRRDRPLYPGRQHRLSPGKRAD